MIKPDVRILELFLSNISGKHFPHFNVTATACPWEYKMVVREGGTSPTKAFLRRSETSEHTCKNPEDICKKRNTFAGHIWIVSLVTNDPHACRCRGDNTWMGEGMGK